jgi:hypothetical protein
MSRYEGEGVQDRVVTQDLDTATRTPGLRPLPSREFAINQAWCLAAAIAADLIAWLQLHALDGDLA